MHEKGYSIRDIAHALKRSPNTISYEIGKRKVRDVYDATKAQHKAYLKRHNASFRGKKIVRHRKLRTFIEESLREYQSPRAISGRLKHHEKHLPYVAKNVIHDFLNSDYGNQIKWERRLPKTRKRQTKKGRLSDRKFIEKRPKVVENRGRVGDCEGDFIVSGRSGKGHLLVVVDRKIRVTFIRMIAEVTVDAVHTSFLEIQKDFPEMKSLTLDNDILFKMHKTLESLLGVPIYFCHPYHSWEKGSVENTNKYIRKYIPKGSDLSQYDKEFIQFVERRCNGRYMEVLYYKTPGERLKESRVRSKKQRERRCGEKRECVLLGGGQ